MKVIGIFDGCFYGGSTRIFVIYFIFGSICELFATRASLSRRQ